MLVNLSDVLTSQGKVIETTVPIELTNFQSRLGDFPVTDKTPVTFTFTNAGTDKAKVEGSAKLTFAAACDRCLTKVPVTLDLHFERMAASPGVEADEEDSRDYMKGYQLDVEALLQNEILVNWPVKILCREDCKGVCPKCGQNLNAKDCGCDTFVPDPRMAVLKDIFDANKEV